VVRRGSERIPIGFAGPPASLGRDRDRLADAMMREEQGRIMIGWPADFKLLVTS
jgi:hypothetical protein